MKKGRHRRYEEARAVKRAPSELRLDEFGFETGSDEPCPECNAEPGEMHATWCLHEQDDEED